MDKALGSLGQEGEEEAEHVFGDAGSPVLRRSYESHTRICDLAIDRLLHVDPEGIAAEVFRRMMAGMMTPEVLALGVSFEGFIEEWVAYACGTPQHVPISTYADCCINYVQELPDASSAIEQTALLAAAPGFIAHSAALA